MERQSMGLKRSAHVEKYCSIKKTIIFYVRSVKIYGICFAMTSVYHHPILALILDRPARSKRLLTGVRHEVR
jgi:hypothetical protein